MDARHAVNPKDSGLRTLKPMVVFTGVHGQVVGQNKQCVRTLDDMLVVYRKGKMIPVTSVYGKDMVYADTSVTLATVPKGKGRAQKIAPVCSYETLGIKGKGMSKALKAKLNASKPKPTSKPKPDSNGVEAMNGLTLAESNMLKLLMKKAGK